MAAANLPRIPENITVHLGAPGSSAQNVTVPFIDYIKNVASSEIYPTWPQAALEANIYAIVSYALNRVYTEYYPSRGYNFDVTNNTQFDQAYVPDREIYDNISKIVDRAFNDYVVRQGSVQPLFTQFCNGTTSTCDGLSQWGTVDLANQGLTSQQILQRYYGDDVGIVFDAPVENIEASYPGTPLRLGNFNNDVKVIQTELNRIRRNYPAIPPIASENGIFGVDTENAVKKFQEIFDLTQDGIVGQETWYRIKQIFNGVKRLSELASEGITLDEASLPFINELSEGDEGEPVRVIQYYLRIIANSNPAVPEPPLNGIFGQFTLASVRAFQEFYGLPVTGIVNENTWNTITRIYSQVIATLPQGYEGREAKFFPGFYLTEGMRNESVRDFQTYLALVGRALEAIPEVPVTGFYGPQTRDAVFAVQRLFGLPETGAVGPLTWYSIAQEYNILNAAQ